MSTKPRRDPVAGTMLTKRLKVGSVCRGPDHDYAPVRHAHPTMPVAPQVTKMATTPMKGGVGDAVRVNVQKLGKVVCRKCGRVTWLPYKGD